MGEIFFTLCNYYLPDFIEIVAVYKIPGTVLCHIFSVSGQNVHYLRQRRRLCFQFGLFVCLSVRRISEKIVNGF